MIGLGVSHVSMSKNTDLVAMHNAQRQGIPVREEKLKFIPGGSRLT
jgi:hypothetical protein